MLRLYEDLAKHCGTAVLGCGSAQGQSDEGAREHEDLRCLPTGRVL